MNHDFSDSENASERIWHLCWRLKKDFQKLLSSYFQYLPPPEVIVAAVTWSLCRLSSYSTYT